MKKLLYLAITLFAVQISLAESSVDPKQVALEKDYKEAMTQKDLNINSRKLATYLYEKLTIIENQQSELMTGETKNAFLISCEKWKIWIGTEAEFIASSYEGGTIQPLVYNSAIIELVKTRIQKMEKIHPEYFEQK